MEIQRAVWWPAAAALLLLAVGAWELHDSDSLLYAAMAEDLAQRPLRLWLAPEWQGHWGREGLFVEHPAGHLMLAAALVRFGAMGSVAVCALNVLAWACSLQLVTRLMVFSASAPAARRARALWLLSPMFLQYLLRGNQEHPLTACVLAAVASIVLAAHFWTAALAFCCSCAGALAIKGLAGAAAVLLGFAAAALVPTRCRNPGRAAMAGAALLAAVVVAYLHAYAQVSGQDFWALHLREQVSRSVGFTLAWERKAYNLLYYLARPCWYALPAVALWGLQIARLGLHACYRHPMQRLGFVAACIFIGGFSLADRKADRYLFALYPFLAMAAAAQPWWSHATSPRRKEGRRPQRARWKLAHALDAHQGSVLTVAVLSKGVLSRIAYVFLRLWPGA